jgi:hypothetical protein
MSSIASWLEGKTNFRDKPTAAFDDTGIRWHASWPAAAAAAAVAAAAAKAMAEWRYTIPAMIWAKTQLTCSAKRSVNGSGHVFDTQGCSWRRYARKPATSFRTNRSTAFRQ